MNNRKDAPRGVPRYALSAAAATASAAAVVAEGAAAAAAAVTAAAAEDNEKRDNDDPKGLFVENIAKTVVHSNLQFSA